MVSAENQRPVSIEVADAKGYTRPPLHDFFMTRYTEAYAAEIATFIAALGGKGRAEPTGEDGLIALALADAAVKSVAEGRVAWKMSEFLSASGCGAGRRGAYAPQRQRPVFLFPVGYFSTDETFR